MAKRPLPDPVYPERERLRAVKPDADVIARFLEWFHVQGFEVARPNEHGSLYPAYIEHAGNTKSADSIPALLEAYFEIDPWKIEDEKEAMLEACRRANGDA